MDYSITAKKLVKELLDADKSVKKTTETNIKRQRCV